MSNTKKFNVSLPSMSTARSGCAAAAHGGKVFVMGGRGGDAQVIVSGGGGEDMRTSEMYDVATQRWTPIAPMITARGDGAAVSFKGRIVVMGGHGGFPRHLCGYLSSVEQYDPISEQWTSLPSMNKERHGCAAAVVDGKIIVVGGSITRVPDEDGSLSLVGGCGGEEFDPDTQEWSEIPPMHFKRAYCAAAVLDGQLYVMGGEDVGGRTLSSAEVYNPTTKRWTLINDMATPRVGCAAVSLGGRIVVVGGYRGYQYNDGDYLLCSCESYNPATQKWSSAPSMNTKREGCAAVEVEGTLYVLGGFNGETHLSLMEYLPYCEFFAFLLDEQPDLAKDLDLDDTMMPTFLSFVGRHCKMGTMWRVIRSRQDLLTL